MRSTIRVTAASKPPRFGRLITPSRASGLARNLRDRSAGGRRRGAARRDPAGLPARARRPSLPASSSGRPSAGRRRRGRDGDRGGRDRPPAGAGSDSSSPPARSRGSPPAWPPLPRLPQAANAASSRSNPEAAKVARPPGPLTVARPSRTASVASGRDIEPVTTSRRRPARKSPARSRSSSATCSGRGGPFGPEIRSGVFDPARARTRRGQDRAQAPASRSRRFSERPVRPHAGRESDATRRAPAPISAAPGRWWRSAGLGSWSVPSGLWTGDDEPQVSRGYMESLEAAARPRERCPPGRRRPGARRRTSSSGTSGSTPDPWPYRDAARMTG